VALSLSDLVFLHWAVEPDLLRPALPEGLALDTFEGSAWLSAIVFQVTRVRTRLTRATFGVKSFSQLIFRTYATAGDRPGTYSLGMDVDYPMIARAAQAAMGLEISHASIRLQHDNDGWVRYHGTRPEPPAPPAQYSVASRPVGEAARSRPGEVDHFLHERYCDYSPSPSGEPRHQDFHHEPCRVQPAESVTTGMCPRVAGAPVELGQPTLTRFVPNMHLVAWLPSTARLDIAPSLAIR